MNTSRFIVHTVPVEVQISLGGGKFSMVFLYFGYILASNIRPTSAGGRVGWGWGVPSRRAAAPLEKPTTCAAQRRKFCYVYRMLT